VNIAPVGTAALGAGRWGQLDLGGNVSEWNLDYFFPYSYENPCTDCAELNWQDARVKAGGGYDWAAFMMVPSFRSNDTPDARSDSSGFRCARTP
jgi:formylglycine-generating enzyme required for sulfatase activity